MILPSCPADAACRAVSYDLSIILHSRRFCKEKAKRQIASSVSVQQWAGLPLELAVVQVGVEAVLGKEVLVPPLLDDVAVLHDENHIRLADGGQAVGHDEAGPGLHHSVERLLDVRFGAGVDGAGRLVENEHGRRREHHARDAQQLPLPGETVHRLLSPTAPCHSPPAGGG